MISKSTKAGGNGRLDLVDKKKRSLSRVFEKNKKKQESNLELKKTFSDSYNKRITISMSPKPSSIKLWVVSL